MKRSILTAILFISGGIAYLATTITPNIKGASLLLTAVGILLSLMWKRDKYWEKNWWIDRRHIGYPPPRAATNVTNTYRFTAKAWVTTLFWTLLTHPWSPFGTDPTGHIGWFLSGATILIFVLWFLGRFFLPYPYRD